MINDLPNTDDGPKTTYSPEPNCDRWEKYLTFYNKLKEILAEAKELNCTINVHTKTDIHHFSPMEIKELSSALLIGC